MPLGSGYNKFRPQCLNHCCASPAVALWFVVPCSWQGVGSSTGGQHAPDRLTLCTGMGVTLGFTLQMAHRAPELEITQAIPISSIPREEAESQLQPDYRYRPSGLQESWNSPRAGSSHNDLPSPSCKLTSHTQPYCSPTPTQLTCTVWAKCPKNS